MFPLSRRVIEPLKLALAVAIIYLIAFYMGWEKPYWATVSAVSVRPWFSQEGCRCRKWKSSDICSATMSMTLDSISVSFTVVSPQKSTRGSGRGDRRAATIAAFWADAIQAGAGRLRTAPAGGGRYGALEERLARSAAADEFAAASRSKCRPGGPSGGSLRPGAAAD